MGCTNCMGRFLGTPDGIGNCLPGRPFSLTWSGPACMPAVFRLPFSAGCWIR